jgi:flagellar protein FlaG
MVEMTDMIDRGRKGASHMDDSIVNPGLSGSEWVQTFPSITAIPRGPHVAPQQAGAASSGPQKPEAPPTEAHQEKPSKDLVQEVALANAIVEFLNQKVSFSYDTRVDQIVVKVTRGSTEEVIRQIPSEEMIKLMTKFRKDFWKDFRGLIFNRTG